ncbi:MAG TPA: serine hydrolase domain-containing protein [Phototrophicaceae bacterium]|nr:serine hydrolase domain-containing protein [Phototrophicaceae bacterium]
MLPKRQFLGLVLLLCLVGFGRVTLPLRADQSDGDRIADIDSWLTQQTKSNLFSGSVLIASKGSILLDKGYGLANKDWNIPNAPDTRFRIASDTKQFTAMSILMLQEQGKLSVEDHACQYIDNCPAAWADITIRELLTHTSGIHELLLLPDIRSFQALPTSPTNLIARFSSLPLDFQPGTSWRYSNSGYDVLGLIIEKVSGETYPTFVKNHIFKPLGMSDTVYNFSTDIVLHRAQGYTTPTTLGEPFDTSVLYAAGGLYSTTDDLYKWDQALFSGKVVSQKSLDDLIANAVPLSKDNTYGYGLYISQIDGHQEIGHNGGISGFTSDMEYLSDVDFTVIMLTNLYSVNAFLDNGIIVQKFFGAN